MKKLLQVFLFILHTLVAEPIVFIADMMGLTKQNPKYKYVEDKTINWKAVVWYVTLIILCFVFREHLIQFKDFMYSKSVFAK